MVRLNQISEIRCWTSLFTGINVLKNNARTSILLLFIILSIIYCFIGVFRVKHPAGDEPHYLIMTVSMIKDMDLQIDNNYDNRDYEIFFSDHLDRHVITDNPKRSIHSPGLSFMIIPFFIIGGYKGCVVFSSIILSFVLTGGALLSYRLGVELKFALTGAFLFALVPPLITFCGQIYPEVPCAGIIMLHVILLYNEQRSLKPLIMLAPLFMVIPFLHIKFIVLQILLFMAVILCFRKRTIFIFQSIIFGISLITLISFNRYLYGHWSFTPMYNGMSVLGQGNIIIGIGAYLFDPQYGILFQSPVYILALAGLFINVRDLLNTKNYFLWPHYIIIGYFIFLISSPIFFFGWSTTSRFLIPIIGLLFPFALWLTSRFMNTPLKVYVCILFILSMYWSYVHVSHFSARYDIYEFLAKKFDLSRLFLPRFHYFSNNSAPPDRGCIIWFAFWGMALYLIFILKKPATQ